jgi:hypothetical protein
MTDEFSYEWEDYEIDISEYEPSRIEFYKDWINYLEDRNGCEF